jgi:hypothetical protein
LAALLDLVYGRPTKRANGWSRALAQGRGTASGPLQPLLRVLREVAPGGVVGAASAARNTIASTSLAIRPTSASARIRGASVRHTDCSHCPARDELDVWEGRIEQLVVTDTSIAETDRVALIRARRGQGIFRDRVAQIERRCRITGVENPAHLVASHCKPWRDATNDERLDGENGLLLTPSVDHLFDRGFIGFENDGRLIIAPVAHHPSLLRMGIRVNESVNVGAFTSGQKRYLEFHRDAVLLQAVRK